MRRRGKAESGVVIVEEPVKKPVDDGVAEGARGAAVNLAKPKKTEDRSRKWKILLGAAGVMIAGLVVAIVVVRNLPKEYDAVVEEEENEIIINDASVVCGKIRAKYINDSEFLYEDAMREFQDELRNGDSAYKLALAICYAQFAYNYGTGFDAANEILSEAGDLVDKVDDDSAINYYVTYRTLYVKENDFEMIDYYDGKLAAYKKNAKGNCGTTKSGAEEEQNDEDAE